MVICHNYSHFYCITLHPNLCDILSSPTDSRQASQRLVAAVIVAFVLVINRLFDEVQPALHFLVTNPQLL